MNYYQKTAELQKRIIEDVRSRYKCDVRYANTLDLKIDIGRICIQIEYRMYFSEYRITIIKNMDMLYRNSYLSRGYSLDYLEDILMKDINMIIG